MAFRPPTRPAKPRAPCWRSARRYARPNNSCCSARREKREPVSDIDTAVVDSLKVLDPKRPIREADIDAETTTAHLLSARRTVGSLASFYLTGQSHGRIGKTVRGKLRIKNNWDDMDSYPRCAAAVIVSVRRVLMRHNRIDLGGAHRESSART